MRSRVSSPLYSIEQGWGRLPAWARPAVWLVICLAAIYVPFFDDVWMRMFFLVALYATLGLGLNVVVGLAGLLDLGYVAFFATGAYVVAMLGAPSSPAVDWTVNYWVLFPLAVCVGALVGVLLGLPVLPLRGDYLAIVTLGFGEIIRIMAVNLSDLTNGSSGIYALNRPSLGYREVDEVAGFYAMAVLAGFAVWFAVARLRDSRVGRAWEAIREDEDVAAGMGIDTTRYKLMAFAIGAAIGALGGAIFAPFIDFVAPQSFSLTVSINVLAVVVIGGMGSTQGVIAGALILVGFPELLQFEETANLLGKLGSVRDALNTVADGISAIPGIDVPKLPPADEWGERLAEYRFIVFGLLLVTIMATRPAGLFASRRRRLEFERVEPADVGAAS